MHTCTWRLETIRWGHGPSDWWRTKKRALWPHKKDRGYGLIGTAGAVCKHAAVEGKAPLCDVPPLPVGVYGNLHCRRHPLVVVHALHYKRPCHLKCPEEG